MSMVYFVWPLLYFLFPRPSLAGPLYTASLHTSVLTKIPRCAQSCVKNFVARSFSSSDCGPQHTLDCLCKSDSTSGITLGEGAYTCVGSDCSTEGLDEETLFWTYHICQSIPDAKPMTHDVLTATQTLTTHLSTPKISPTGCERTRSPSSIRISKTQRSTSSATSCCASISTSTVSKIPSSTPSSKMSTLPSNTATASAPSSTASITAAVTKPALAKSQIAGIAIGGVVCIAGAIGLLILVFCIRRRRSNRRPLSGSSFGNDKILGSNLGSPGFLSPRNQGSEQAQYTPLLPVPTRDPGSVLGQTQQTAFPRVEQQNGFVTPERKRTGENIYGRRGLHPDEIGIALGSRSRERLVIDEAPTSDASHRRSSKLLPNQSNYSLYPSSSRPQNPRSPVSPINSPLLGEAGIGQKGPTPFRAASPRLGSPPDTNQRLPQRGFSPMHASASDPFLDRQHPGPQTLTHTSPRRQPLRINISSSDRPPPELMKQGQWTQSLDDIQKPVPARHSSSARGFKRQKTAFASISPNDYAGRSLFQPSADRPSHVKQKGPRTKGITRPRPAPPRYSSASETNFEDTDGEEEIPPMPTSHHFLSPIQSSSDVTPSEVRGSVPSQQIGPRPTPTSPTPNRARRDELLASPRRRQSLSGSKGMQTRKPLPELPELPDTPVIATVQGPREKPRAISINNRRAAGDVRNTAKWQILVEPGLTGIDRSRTPPPQAGSTGRLAIPSKQIAARPPTQPPRRNR